MKAFPISILVILLITSCQDDTETRAELTARKMKADISSSGAYIQSISVVSIYDAAPIFVGTTYEIASDGFIVITTNAGESATFNLDELKSYLISPSSLALYF